MAEPRFLPIHTLTPYTAALLNRDDSGLAKRLPYDGTLRTRISSQCLKRHWRITDDPHSLHAIDGAEVAYRSRELVTRLVLGRLSERYGEQFATAIGPDFQMAVYGDKGTIRTRARPCCSVNARSRGCVPRRSGWRRKRPAMSTPQRGWLRNGAKASRQT